jgi:YD repeat-containing protein
VQDTPQSFYAYVKSTTVATALDASKLSFTLQSNYAGGNTGPQPFGASITDSAGNLLNTDPMLDDTFVINASTPTLASNPTFVARPETGVGGFDTLDLSALSSTQPIDVLTTDGQIIVQGATPADTKVYRFEDFDEFVINNAGGVNFRGSQDASEVVQLKVASSNDIRLANKPTTDLSAETDIVDYSATANAVTVNLGSTTNGGDGWFYATATKGALGIGGVDKIAGAEGIFGSTAGDTITGNSRDNLLAGGAGAGNDTLDGAAGNDVLVGGAGSGDILIGGTGKDILIDLDGGTLTGSAAKKNQGASGDQDVFVVRNGSTIENFHVARDGAGLAGRAAASANDTILFNLSVGVLSEKLAGYSAAVAGKSAAQLQVELAKIKGDIDIRVERTAAGSDDWAVIASYTGGLHSSTVELARVIVKDMDTSVMPASSVLTDVALPDFSFENAMSDKIDELVFSQVSDLLVDDQAINLAVALESVRQGTVRESKNGLMFGDFNLAERIFNPGVGSEKIFGSNKKDTYEFLVQDLRTTNGSATSDAGMDSIMDTGGDDTVAFSNITLINQLDFTAVQLGRESGNYSLRSNYSQSAEGITNTGGFTWTGHFREGMGMELEKITLGNTTLEMADVRYRYDEEGNLLGWTPNQVASSGKDTIMVGGVGRSADASTFVVEKGTDAAFNTGIGADNKQNLFLWDADASDVIDLKAFFADATTARNAVQDSTSAMPRSTFTIDLNTTQDLVLNFMDTNLTQESLEMMIARAYG